MRTRCIVVPVGHGPSTIAHSQLMEFGRLVMFDGRCVIRTAQHRC